MLLVFNMQSLTQHKIGETSSVTYFCFFSLILDHYRRETEPAFGKMAPCVNLYFDAPLAQVSATAAGRGRQECGVQSGGEAEPPTLPSLASPE